MKKGRLKALLIIAFFTIGPTIALLQEPSRTRYLGFDYYLGWYLMLCVWAGFGFACACDNMARRKGYQNKFIWGLLFGFFGFLYWSLVPPAWDHPEYMEERIEHNRMERPKRNASTGYRATESQSEVDDYPKRIQRRY